MSEDQPKKTPKKGFIRRTSLGQKSLWDWLNLLILPVMLGIGGIWIEWQVGAQQRAFEKQREEQAQMLQEQRAQEEALQAYLGQMSELILAHDLLRCDVEEEQCYEVRTLAEARTETVLQRLDSDLNQHLIDFLWGADLLGVEDPLEDPEAAAKKLRLLSNAPLSEVDFARTNLIEVDLSLSDLSGADLHEAHLYKTILEQANLLDADLSNAYMVGAKLGAANLTNADLSGADLRDALVNAHLRDTDLRDANLSGVDLSGSDLRGADLRGANLRGAKLIDAATMDAGKEDPTWPEEPWGGADLRDADLSDAYKTTNDGSKQPITDADLEQQTRLLEGATMPDGQKYEE